MGWQPILDGALADRARTTIRAIARALARGEGEVCKPSDATLFWAYVAGELDETWIQDAYDAAVDRLASAASAGFGGDLSLFHGAAGAGFVIAHVSEPELVEDSLVAIDSAIDERVAAVARWGESYDLIDGLIGLGVYLLDRSERSPPAARALGRVVDQLAALAEPRAEGLAWFTPPSQLTDDQRAAFPEGHFNCGLAHGVPGIVSMLARIATSSHAAAPQARELALGGHRWLSAQRLPAGQRSCYPAWVGPDGERTPTRTAWCYGDAGTATALWDAALRLGLSVEDAVSVAREVAMRPLDACRVQDAGLCHGAAGLAHILTRWYAATGDASYLAAARAWFERVLAMQRAGGVAGYAAWSRDRDTELRWIPRTSLLEGVAGIGLALLAAVTTVEPAWDRYFLVDLPPLH